MTEAEKIAGYAHFGRPKVVDRGNASPLTEAEIAELIEAYATRLASEAAADMRQRAAELIGEWGTRQDILTLPLLPDGASEERGGGWRPISSAPKDGSRVLCLSPAYDGPLFLQWIFYNGLTAWRDWDQDIHYPTHFMELPSPPPAEGE